MDQRLGLGHGRSLFRDNNVDPGLISPLFYNMVVSLVLVGIITFGGEHPHINKQGFIHPGSTLSMRNVRGTPR